MQAIDYRIVTEFIELNQLLKICGLAASGGAGGALVTEGNVRVDGQPELRKRCKIRPGQVVQLGDVRITVLPSDPAEVAAKAEARVVQAREKMLKKSTEPKTAKVNAKAPWGPKTGAKTHAKPKPRGTAPAAVGARRKKPGNVFAGYAEAHRLKQKP